MAKATTLSAQQVRQALYRHFAGSWAVVFEVTARVERPLRIKLEAAGDDDMRRQAVVDGHHERRIDALLVRRTPKRRLSGQMRASIQQLTDARQAGDDPGVLFDVTASPSSPPQATGDGGLERMAIEIKVNRADFFGDVRNPHKQAPWRELAERHAYCVPAGLVSLGDVPADSGLLEVSPGLGVTWARRAPRGVARPLPLSNILDAYYRWSRAEARTRGVDHSTAGDDDVEKMRADLARLRHSLELMERQAERAETIADTWRKRYATLEPPACGTCGRPIRPARKATSMYGALPWEHAPGDEERCRELRIAAAVADGDAWQARYGGPEPVYA